MSKGATMSIMGLYNNDNTVLDLMVFPEDFNEEQKQITKDNILIECAELEFLYPNPTVAKNIIAIWSKKESPYWDRVYKAALYEYNPIENYRRTETETIGEEKTEEHSGSDVNAASGTDSLARTGTETDTLSGTDSVAVSSSQTETNSGSDTTDNSITGYDSNDLVPHDSSETTHGHVIETNGLGNTGTTYGKVDTLEHATTDTQTYGKKDTLTHGEKIEHDGSSERSLLAYGNIGVTTSQEMLTQEMEVAKIIQVIPIIIESFKNRFCLLVY